MAAMVMRPMVADYLDIVTRGDGIELKLEQIMLTEEDPYVGLTIGAGARTVVDRCVRARGAPRRTARSTRIRLRRR